MQAQGFTVGASILGQCSTTSIFGLPTSHVPQPAPSPRIVLIAEVLILQHRICAHRALHLISKYNTSALLRFTSFIRITEFMHGREGKYWIIRNLYHLLNLTNLKFNFADKQER